MKNNDYSYESFFGKTSKKSRFGTIVLLVGVTVLLIAAYTAENSVVKVALYGAVFALVLLAYLYRTFKSTMALIKEMYKDVD